MSQKKLPPLPTTVIGSHSMPGWFWTAIEEIEKGNYGLTDISETYDDAVNAAILDQERAGIDIVSDGEMRRWYFVQSFTKRMKGIVRDPELRKTGLYGYDSPPRYHAEDYITVPNGLGIVDEFKYANENTERPIKATCPGPLTMTMHIRPEPAYKDRMEMAFEFATSINLELRALADAGANYIQIDEPSFAIIPGQMDQWVNLYNKCVEGVDAKHALHVCFGNLTSRPRGKRQYKWMFPEILDTNSDQIVMEFANREMIESDLWAECGDERELGIGVVDIKSFYVETPEDVAERIRLILKSGVNPEKITVSPDCGFFQLPRWLCQLKLKSLVKGTAIVRHELTG